MKKDKTSNMEKVNKVLLPTQSDSDNAKQSIRCDYCNLRLEEDKCKNNCM